ncbi:MAG TPA: DUF5700 domain-containing putative Zn-dependent protease [Bacteroidota bacterium]|nr:DUF5700 domain-containing putative Zn-dependent protease [Bacteroidota bacterium]
MHGPHLHRAAKSRGVIAGYLPCLILLLFSNGTGQTNPSFSIELRPDYRAAEQSLLLFEDNPVGSGSLAALRGNRIAASTTGLIANSDSVTMLLRDDLDSAKYHRILRNDIYHLEEARANAAQIRALLTELERSYFTRKVEATVEQIFPQDARVSLTIPMYAVALGHENVDAYVRSIRWHGDVPEFTGEGEGELTIVINLAHAVRYGDSTRERYLTLLGVVAHEVFHAAFSDYKKHSSFWQDYRSEHHAPIDELFDLTQNEGIAYYLSIDQRGHGYVPRDWYTRARETFAQFNRNGSELLSPRISRERAVSLIRSANLSGSHDSYGAMCGMFIAREIDLRMGRADLIRTIAAGPIDMLRKYLSLAASDNNLPSFSPPIEQYIRSSQ